MIYVRFGTWIELNRPGSAGFLHIDADAHRCSLLQPHSNPFPNPLQSQPHYRSPSKVAPEHQRTESPSPPTPPTKLWQLVLLRLLCGSPSAACLPRSPWRGRFSFRWPYETRFRRTFYPPRSRLTRPRVGFCTWSLPTVAVWSQDGSVAVEVGCILEVQHCHHFGYFFKYTKRHRRKKCNPQPLDNRPPHPSFWSRAIPLTPGDSGEQRTGRFGCVGAL